MRSLAGRDAKHASRSKPLSRHIRTNVVASLFVAAAVVAPAASARASAYLQTDLTTDDNSVLTGLGYPAAANVDPNLNNAWGISFGAATPFWISDNGTGVSTLYTAAGVPAPVGNPLIVTIPSASGQTQGTPTGQVFNGNTSAFIVSNGTTSESANFIFATEDGTISGRSGAVDTTHSFIKVNNLSSGAVYKGLAIATVGTSPIYAANFNSGFTERYDLNWMPAGSFTDTNLPAVPPGTPASQNWAPFNVQVLNGQLYVSFALQAAGKHDDDPGAGHGFVDVFNLDGTFVKRLIDVGATDPLELTLGTRHSAGRIWRFRQRFVGREFRRRRDQRLQPDHRRNSGRVARQQRQPDFDRRSVGSHHWQWRRRGQSQRHLLHRRHQR